MARLLISYDLRKPNNSEKDYAALYDALDSMRAKRIQESVWVVRTDLDAMDLFAQVESHFYPRDRLLVAHMGGFRNRMGISKISGI